MTSEIWKPIPGYEGLYSVSNMGSIRSEARVTMRKDGTPLPVAERLIKTCDDGKGYLRFNAMKDGKPHSLYVHQSMMRAFVGPQESGVEVRHRDGDSFHNRLGNLCYGSKSDNMQDALEHGTFPVLERRPGAKLTREIAKEICASSELASVLAERYGVGKTAIAWVRQGITWQSVTDGDRRESYRRTGDQHPNSKLTAEQAIEIFQSPETQRSLARRFGVDKATIRNIKLGRVWKSVTEQL